MEYLYIDESGSMTSDYCSNNPYFVISIIRVLDEKSLKKSIKRFVRSNWEELKKNDKNHKIFNEKGEFLELKGSAMNFEMKRKMANYLSAKKSFEIFYILLDNNKIDNDLYKNTARAFNYMIKIALTYFINHGLIERDTNIYIQIDERNERPEAKLHLQEYLNTELQLAEKLTREISVKYFDSRKIPFIQIADFFANLEFSQLLRGNYDEQFKNLKNNNIFKKIFKFPVN